MDAIPYTESTLIQRMQIESWREHRERERNGQRIAECLALLHEQDADEAE
jgi:hypothetical protein